MQITFTWQTIITAAAVIGAVVAVVAYLRKLFGWFDRQDKQDEVIKGILAEQEILTYGVLACLKGLHEQGANGPVTEAINKIEAHMIEKAHGGA